MPILQVTAFPCAWPQHWPRTHDSRRQCSNYRQRFDQGRAVTVKELSQLGATEIVVSTNIPLRRDGSYAAVPEPDDPAVAVYWVDRYRVARVAACDHWQRVRENMRAVSIAIVALGHVERSGTPPIIEKAYSGFSLPPDEASSWRGVFGMSAQWQPTLSELATRHRILLSQITTASGDAEFNVLQAAYERGRAECL